METKHSIILVLILIFSNYNSANSQTIIALDTITNTKVEPFSQICKIETFRVRKFKKDRSFESTGFFIAPNVILTAAHNLYSNKLTKVVKIKLLPGKYKDQNSYDSIVINGDELSKNLIRVHSKFNWNKVDFDFGIIIIPDSIINRLKNWPKVSSFNLDKTYNLKKGDTLRIAGFPANGGYDGSIMTYEAQIGKDFSTKKISHSFHTETGNSGSPLWIENGGKKIIIGIHTYTNLATRIDKEYIELIESWINN